MKTKKFFQNMILSTAICTLLTGTTAFADENVFSDSETYRDDNSNICVDFGEIQVHLPANWSGLCQMSASDDSVAFYQTKSRNLYKQDYGYATGGWLFSINCSEELDFLEHPNYEILGSCDGLTYYITYPTDVQGYIENAEAMTEYSSMYEDLTWIEDNIYLPYGDEIVWDDYYSSDEHILPQSSTEYLELEDIEDMDAAELQMAINEIYARHHRRFVLTEVQEYFDSCSWYEGTIEAADFDVSVMNTYEGANIALLVERMNEVKANPQDVAGISSGTKDCYGMIIESGDGYFQVRQSDGTVIQFWYEPADLDDMGILEEELSAGATVSLIYTLESYQAVDILIF